MNSEQNPGNRQQNPENAPRNNGQNIPATPASGPHTPSTPNYGQNTPNYGQTYAQGPAYRQPIPPYNSPSSQYAQNGYAPQNGYAYGQNNGYGYGIPQAPRPYPAGQNYQQPYANNGMPQMPAYGAQSQPRIGGQQNNASATNAEPPLWMPWYGISFPNAIKRLYTKYATFSGRASRSEYWWIMLYLFLAFIVFGILSAITDDSIFVTLLQGIWNLATIIPMLALSVRRLHDTNRSGWWLLLMYIMAIIGVVILIAGGIGMVGSFLYGDHDAFSTSSGATLIGGLLLFVSGVMQIVLMAIGSNPEGARYDRPQQY